MPPCPVSWTAAIVSGIMSSPYGLRTPGYICKTSSCPSGNPGWTGCSFRSGNEELFVVARKSRACAEAYTSTPHKRGRRLTQPRRKRTVSGRKLVLVRVQYKRFRYVDSTKPSGDIKRLCERVFFSRSFVRLGPSASLFLNPVTILFDPAALFFPLQPFFNRATAGQGGFAPLGLLEALADEAA